MCSKTTYATQSDCSLMVQVSEMDDQCAYAELFDRHHDRAVALARNQLRSHNHHVAEEAAQQGFLRLWVSRDKWNPFPPWFNRLVLNEANSINRLVNREQNVGDPEMLDGNENPEEAEHEEGTFVLLARAFVTVLRGRNEATRRVLLARYFETIPDDTGAFINRLEVDCTILASTNYPARTFHEVIDVTGVSLGTVHNYLSSFENDLLIEIRRLSGE